MVECAGDADPLALASRKADAALAYYVVETLRQLINEGLQLRGTERAPDGGVIDLLAWQTKGNIPAKGVVGEEDGLWHIANLVLPPA